MTKLNVQKIVSDHMATIGRKGGKAMADSLTAAQRKRRAKRAALARWAKSPRGITPEK